eukprot:CAMPEP_0169165336 /NCGR_PEP_ID=MMETSP1015-20121227/59355_1 /TAXON_ID=342587 /ORGANISM="Karlodinium micrum, Strain CCMP2283" /LENGTH=208 /DNA_ID=CAMNT_0009237915 /DNA_START=21 /DNA_END=644 /DNA_ORIENTATION=+
MATEVPAEDWVTDYVMQFMKSPSWTGPIESFIDDNCKSFDLVDTEENKLEYTAIHNEFKDMVESLLVAHLLDVDVTPDQFASILERAVLAVKEPDSNLDQIVTQIVSVGDFLVFRRMMTSRFVQQQQEVAACLQPALTEQTVSQVEVQNVPSASIPSYQAQQDCKHNSKCRAREAWQRRESSYYPHGDLAVFGPHESNSACRCMKLWN